MDILSGRVSAIVDVSPSMRRFTLRGPDLARYLDTGLDQRIKVIFPTEQAPLSIMPRGEQWYAQWRELPEQQQPPLRTYTTRFVRNELCEVDIDMVVHDVCGPASAWIETATLGDELLVCAPTHGDEPPYLGIDFVPPASVGQYLLAGDETAAPAIAVILESLPASAQGMVVVEMPTDADAAYFPAHPGFTYHVAGREGRERHDYLEHTLRTVVPALCPPGHGAEVTEINLDEDILWDVPRNARGGAVLQSAPLYVWLAGEAGIVKTLRRFLVSEHGVDRRAVAFMGYWRLGHA